MKLYTSNENDFFSKGSFNITKSPNGPFIADHVRMYKDDGYLIVAGDKILDSGERAGVSLFFLDIEGTFKGNFGGPDETPWGYYKIGNWLHSAQRGETTHTYLDKPEHVTGKFSFIISISGTEHECEGDFNVQGLINPFP